MSEHKHLDARRLSFTIISMLAILTSCAALAFAITVIMFAPDLGAEKHFTKDESYTTFDVRIETVGFYDQYIEMLVDHSESKFGNGMMISSPNVKIAYDNGAKDLLKENVTVSVTLAHKFIGSNWCYEIVAMQCGETVILPYETGKPNIVNHLTTKSQGIKKALITTGCFLAVMSTALTVSIVVTKKKKIFYKT